MNLDFLKNITDEQLNIIVKSNPKEILNVFTNELKRREDEKKNSIKINIGDTWLMHSNGNNESISIKYIDKFEDEEYLIKCYDIFHGKKDVDFYIDYNTEKYLKIELSQFNFIKVDSLIINKLDELTDEYIKNIEQINNKYYDETMEILKANKLIDN